MFEPLTSSPRKCRQQTMHRLRRMLLSVELDDKHSEIYTALIDLYY